MTQRQQQIREWLAALALVTAFCGGAFLMAHAYWGMAIAVVLAVVAGHFSISEDNRP